MEARDVTPLGIFCSGKDLQLSSKFSGLSLESLLQNYSISIHFGFFLNSLNCVCEFVFVLVCFFFLFYVLSNKIFTLQILFLSFCHFDPYLVYICMYVFLSIVLNFCFLSVTSVLNMYLVGKCVPETHPYTSTRSFSGDSWNSSMMVATPMVHTTGRFCGRWCRSLGLGLCCVVFLGSQSGRIPT